MSKLDNFNENDVWISKNKVKYRIVSVERVNPICWYPVLLENLDTKILYTTCFDGYIYKDFREQNDKLVMRVSSDFTPQPKNEKDLADRMLVVYNKRKELLEKERELNNKKVKRLYRLIKK